VNIMLSARNCQNHARRDSIRRLRFDNLASIVVRNNPGPGATPPSAMNEHGHSGRRFVLVAGFTLLVLCGVLYLIFRDWRSRYLQRADYGATQVAPAIDPLRAIVPADVDPAAWREAVDQTRAMLITVTSSNLLDVKDMSRLRTELDRHVARARDHPETALRELAEIWNQMAVRAEFLFRDTRSKGGERHPRPPILPPKPRDRSSALVN
jgi:hypothetical protein